ncbi:immunoglobulin superfamily member 3-like [Embiotoca jacksoni]|uniref:immunoglobulin superfamily member 3-like n=1 Tax=Embiotoca jacksoni TaxID=100190 RepID=UPI003703F8C4
MLTKRVSNSKQLATLNTLVPVTTVQIGEPVTLTCSLLKFSSVRFKWYKQSAGDNLKLIVTLLTSTSAFEPEFPQSRFQAHLHDGFSNLTILRTVQEDEGMYHCTSADWINTAWTGTYLLVKGNNVQTSNYTVTQWPTASGPGRDSATLQCSILSDPEHMKCPGHHSVFWFRVGSDESHPDTIYTDRHRNNECDEKYDAQKSCVYRFSKNISSSDAGTYFCAVATCGRILFGNISKLHLAQTTHSVLIERVILIVCLAISVIGNVVLICKIRVCEQRRASGTESALSETQKDASRQPIDDTTEAEHNLNYAPLNFSERKATRGRKKREFAEDCVYSQVKH